MKIYLVSYNLTNWYIAYCGRGNYHIKTDRYFSTREKAEKFVESVVYERDPYKQMDVIAKDSGEGEIVEIDVE